MHIPVNENWADLASPEEVSAKHTDAIRFALIAIFARETQDFASLLFAGSVIKQKSSSCHYTAARLSTPKTLPPTRNELNFYQHISINKNWTYLTVRRKILRLYF